MLCFSRLFPCDMISLRFFSLAIAGLFFIPLGFAEGTPFSDISGTSSSEAVTFLQEEGVVNGFEDSTFRPEKDVTRAEFLKIALQAKTNFSAENCEAEKDFYDVSEKDWFFPYVCFSVNNNIIQGYNDNTFRPHEPINFRDAAKIIANVYDIHTDKNEGEEWYLPYVNAILRERVFPGSVQSSSALLTRGEMAQMIWGITTGHEVENKTLGELPFLQNCEELSVQLKKQTLRSGIEYKNGEGDIDMVMTKDMAIDESTSDETVSARLEGSDDDFSGTNVQEEGVDEADIVKNDGSHIFLVKNNAVHIVRAYPPEELAEDSTISLAEENITPQEMFLDGDRLTLIGVTRMTEGGTPRIHFYSDEMSFAPSYSGKVLVLVYDVSDRKNPKKVRSVSLEGNYLSSRRIDENVFVAVSSGNFFWGGNLDPILLEKELPLITDSVSSEPEKITCGTIRYVPNFPSANLLTLLTVNTQDETKKPSRETVLGGGETLYASLKNIYVTSTGWGETYWKKGNDSGWKSTEKTDIFRFSLQEGGVKFSGKAQAVGHPINQFSMSENDEYFRIATQVGEAWGNALSETVVSIFNNDLQEVSRIDGIAPGENMKSARFLGNKLYLVTFKTVDPLFVIDLTPTSPKILGKLKIPGWSDYLHPWGESYLLGFGKEVDESIDADKVHSDSAVYYTAVLGMKISLFDISDIEHPKEVQKEIIGYRGTTSELLQNHKALLADMDKGIIGFPITITENKNGKSGSEADVETVFSGARVYTVDAENGFSLKGSVTHYASNDVFLKSGEYFFGDYNLNIQRILFIGDTFYSISPNVVTALSGKNLSKIKTLELEKRTCEEIFTESECIAKPECEAVYWTSSECRRSSENEEMICTDDPQFSQCETK